ncbi:hypothetical protein [Vibrio diazotrophicus]|uniref:GGDEF domain-containing protein n=1 Tax=Vibrio diazotrophicus TaxID=685 RepID=A0ABX4WG46_VIBDI|nr:hypothetical protein [Vibrio diazotrophicus]PNI02149.1 hypothetical protein C1O25_05375 [Vibrio diazotrophicus]
MKTNLFNWVVPNIISLTASFCIASRMKIENLDQLFNLADKQLYIAKSRGRNRVEPHSDSCSIFSLIS